LKILLANTTCKVGGVSTFMLSLRSALQASGHTCELFFFERGPMEDHLPPEVPVHFGSLADLLRLVQREGFDVVHANNVDWPTGISAVRQLGVKLVVTAHKVRDTAWTYGWMSRDCDALVAVSGWVGRELQRFTDVAIQTVPNGVDTDRFRPGDEDESSPPIVAWVGRGGAKVKRIEMLAAIAPALRRAGIRIWIIDQHGPDKVAEINPDAAISLRALTEVWRGVPFADMPRVYREVAASGGTVLSTASQEGLGLALVEAQACRCMVIAADVRGVNECVSRDHGGVLYPLAMSAAELAEFVIGTLTDREQVRARQERASRHVRAHFSLQRMAEDYVRIYRDCPYTPVNGLRRRLRLSPVLHHRAYMGRRYGVGHRQYEVSQDLGRAGDWRLAAAAARASFRVAPTLYLRPGRLAHLLRAQWRSAMGKAPHSASAAGYPTP
jgi:glycosyltransferase involved in cell wall biosynthesis